MQDNRRISRSEKYRGEKRCIEKGKERLRERETLGIFMFEKGYFHIPCPVSTSRLTRICRFIL